MIRTTITPTDRHARLTPGRLTPGRLTPGRLTLAAAAAVLSLAPMAAHAQDNPAARPAPTTAPADAPVPAAVADIQDLIARKQYPAAVRAAGKLLTAGGPTAEGISRFQVLMLRGDAQAGTHAMAAARTSYLSAAHETQDPHERALATWTATLFQRARGTSYVPHVTGAGNGAGNGGPIDLVDRDSRKAAFAAMLDDELSALSPKIKAASKAPNLPPILPVVQQVQGLAELDEIANGSDAATAAKAGPLLDHARSLMSNALKGMWTRISDIHTSATRQTTAAGQSTVVNGQLIQQTLNSQNGLTQQDRAELQQIIVTCGQIKDAAGTFMPLADGTQDKEWGAVQNDAIRVAGRANDVLQGNYSSTSVTDTATGGGNGADGNGYNTGLNGTIDGTTIGGNGITRTYGPGGYPGQITNPRTGGVVVIGGGTSGTTGGVTGGTAGGTTTGGSGTTTGGGTGGTGTPGSGTITPTPTPTPRIPVPVRPPRRNIPTTDNPAR